MAKVKLHTHLITKKIINAIVVQNGICKEFWDKKFHVLITELLQNANYYPKEMYAKLTHLKMFRLFY